MLCLTGKDMVTLEAPDPSADRVLHEVPCQSSAPSHRKHFAYKGINTDPHGHKVRPWQTFNSPAEGRPVT